MRRPKGWSCFFLLWLAGCAEPPAPVFQATGIKIAEVDQDSALVWTRITAAEHRVGPEGGEPVFQYRDDKTGETTTSPKGRRAEALGPFPDQAAVDKFEGAAPGAPGQTRARYRLAGEPDWTYKGWQTVDCAQDCTTVFPLEDLRPGSRYELEVDARPGPDADTTSTIVGGFKTAPAADDPARVVFTVTTGTAYPDQDAPGGGYKMYAQMLKLDPSFFVHTGDIIYYDQLAKNEALARWHWQRMYSLPTNVAFHRQVACYMIKDDHDVWMNDCWPTLQSRFMGDFTFAQGQKIFLEQTGIQGPTFRTIRWGKDLQVWFPEGRDFRSPNTMEDGPEKSIWGAEQKAWLKKSMAESDATFRVLISATPIVGPDRGNKNDNHANKGFQHEGDEIRSFLAGLKNAYVACGDRHWQYVSQDAETGLREYSSGPASDEHAGGFSQDQRTEEHAYLNVIGGFLAGTVERVEGKPQLTWTHYGVDGSALHQEVRPAE
ncbi:MAG: alkaline phosphatase [Acidobacteria bacterium]|nr:alkaline phosphatase [Acidobacteriota bacterium]